MIRRAAPSSPVAALLLLLGLLSVLVVAGATAGFDRSVLDTAMQADRPPLIHDMARVVVVVGQYRLVEPVVVALNGWAAWRTRQWRVLVLSSAGLLILDGGMWLLKHVSGRTAPRSGLDHLLAGGTSFPSGHAASATVSLLLIAEALAVGLGWTRRTTRVAWAVAATVSALVGISAVVLGWHWPTDVVGGWIAGAAAFLAAHRILDAPPSASAEPAALVTAGRNL
jgi:undecaprenyl-diphosphatase